MNYRAALWLLFWSLIPASGVAQAWFSQPSLSIHVGFGNHYGWVGTAGEAYLLPGRLSAFAGIGVMPRELFNDFPTTVAGAGGLRYYVPLRDSRHRAFADLSVSLLQLSRPAMIGAPVNQDYGPGFSIGYSYVAASGLTVTGGAGAGRANDSTVPVLHLGIGWTWRR
jgi:hypothetical protein